MLDLSKSQALSVDPLTEASEAFTAIPPDPRLGSGLNALTCARPRRNGLAFNKAGDALFVASTGDDRVIRFHLIGGVAGTPEQFVNRINGTGPEA